MAVSVPAIEYGSPERNADSAEMVQPRVRSPALDFAKADSPKGDGRFQTPWRTRLWRWSKSALPRSAAGLNCSENAARTFDPALAWILEKLRLKKSPWRGSL